MRPQIDAPVFQRGDEIKLGTYIFVVCRIELVGVSNWQYHGKIYKGENYVKYGRMTEFSLVSMGTKL